MDFSVYATTEQVETGFRKLSADEEERCNALIVEAGVMIDAIAQNARNAAKRLVTCRMVRRVLGSAESDTPIGTTQGTVSALGYSQTWALSSGGAVGELYIGKAERSILGVQDKIGASNPLEGCCRC